MTYQEKLNNSVILKTGLIPKASFGIISNKKRKNSIIAFILIAIYTILNKFVFHSIEKFDIMYVILIVNLVLLFVLKLIANSTFKLNHVTLYSVVFFFSRLCKLILFITAYIQSTEFFLFYFNDYFEILNFEGQFYTCLLEGIARSSFDSLNLLINDYNLNFNELIIPFITREISILLFIPVFLYFLGVYINYVFKFIKILFIALIPIANITYYFKWLLSTDVTFTSYHESEDPKFLEIEWRRLTSESAKEIKSQTRAIKFLQSILWLAVFAIIGLGIYMSINIIGAF